MTPIQKAKEIAEVIYTNIIEYGRQAMPPDWKEYSETTEGKALIGSVISGEDWKEDGGLKWINASTSLPALEKVVFIKDNVGLERLGNFYENEEGGHNLYIQPNGVHDGFTVNGENENFSHYNWLYDPN